MRYYPVYLDLRDRICFVIGGGTVAERKTLSLLEAGAEVQVVSPTLSLKLQELSGSGKITHKQKIFEDSDIHSAYLVIAATSSPDVNRSVAAVCRTLNLLVNVAAPPELSSFIVPSVVDRGELQIAVSTSGASPALSRRIRNELEERYGDEYDLFLQKMDLVRNRLVNEVGDEAIRRGIFQSLVESDIIELLKQGRTHDADVRIAQITGLKKR